MTYIKKSIDLLSKICYTKTFTVVFCVYIYIVDIAFGLGSYGHVYDSLRELKIHNLNKVHYKLKNLSIGDFEVIF